MKNLLLFSFSVFLIAFAGCSHTNELAKYNVRGQNYLYRDFVSSNAGMIQIVTEDYSAKKDSGQSDTEKVLSAIASIGSDIISENAKEKLENSVNTQSLVGYISTGLEEALKTYLDAKSVETVDDNPQFIVETTLNECKLIVRKNGTFVNVNAKSVIIDRATGNVVWDNTEVRTIPINTNYTGSKETSSVENKIFNAIQLTSLSEEELNKAVGRAAEEAGYEMGKTLREDVAEINKK